MKRGLVVGVAVVVIVAVLAFFFLPRVDRGLQLRSAEARWTESGILDYRWWISRGCFCPTFTGTVVVRDGEVVSVRVNGERITRERASELGYQPLTVEELFDMIGHALGSDGFTVAFDDELGYPTSGSFDPQRNGYDDEWGFEAHLSPLG